MKIDMKLEFFQLSKSYKNFTERKEK